MEKLCFQFEENKRLGVFFLFTKYYNLNFKYYYILYFYFKKYQTYPFLPSIFKNVLANSSIYKIFHRFPNFSDFENIFSESKIFLGVKRYELLLNIQF